MTTLLVEDFGARWRPDLFGLGGVFAKGRIGRVTTTTGDRGLGGGDSIGPFPDALEAPASCAGGLARARAGYNRSCMGTFALTLRARVAPPLLFTICCQRILQLNPPENVSARVIHESSMGT